MTGLVEVLTEPSLWQVGAEAAPVSGGTLAAGRGRGGGYPGGAALMSACGEAQEGSGAVWPIPDRPGWEPLGWTGLDPLCPSVLALDGSHAWWLSDLHPKVNAGPFLLSAQTLPTFPTGSSPVSRSQPAASANRQLEWWGKEARDSGVRCQQLPR